MLQVWTVFLFLFKPFGDILYGYNAESIFPVETQCPKFSYAKHLFTHLGN